MSVLCQALGYKNDLIIILVLRKLSFMGDIKKQLQYSVVDTITEGTTGTSPWNDLISSGEKSGPALCICQPSVHRVVETVEGTGSSESS